MSRKHDDGTTEEGVEEKEFVLAEAAAQLKEMIALNESRIAQLRDYVRRLDALLDTVTLRDHDEGNDHDPPRRSGPRRGGRAE